MKWPEDDLAPSFQDPASEEEFPEEIWDYEDYVREEKIRRKRSKRSKGASKEERGVPKRKRAS